MTISPVNERKAHARLRHIRRIQTAALERSLQCLVIRNICTGARRTDGLRCRAAATLLEAARMFRSLIGRPTSSLAGQLLHLSADLPDQHCLAGADAHGRGIGLQPGIVLQHLRKDRRLHVAVRLGDSPQPLPAGHADAYRPCRPQPSQGRSSYPPKDSHPSASWRRSHPPPPAGTDCAAPDRRAQTGHPGLHARADRTRPSLLTVSSMLGLASSVATPLGTCVAYSPPPSTARKNTAAAATQRFHAPRRRPRSGIGTTFSSSGCCAGACTRARMLLQQSGVSATTSVRSCSSNSLSVKIVTSHRIAQLCQCAVIS